MGCGHLLALDPWKDCLPPVLHGFYKCSSDTLHTLNKFLFRVVVARVGNRHGQDGWVRTSWFRHHQVAWAESGRLVSYLVCPPGRTPGDLGILVLPSLIDAHFGKAWLRRMRFFTLLGRTLARMILFNCSFLTAEDLHGAALACKKLLLFGLWSLPGSHGRSKRDGKVATTSAGCLHHHDR